jgi:hypothetical protein
MYQSRNYTRNCNPNCRGNVIKEYALRWFIPWLKWRLREEKWLIPQTNSQSHACDFINSVEQNSQETNITLLVKPTPTYGTGSV